MKIGLPESCRIALTLILLSILPSGCHKSPEPFNNDHSITAEDRAEANVIAVCLSGNVTAPQGLSSRVLADLAEIRSRFGGLELINTIRFRPPWAPSNVIVSFEPETVPLVANGQYHGWDELNQRFQVSKIDLHTIKWGYVVLRFQGQLHGRRLAELYRELPGVRHAEQNSMIGDGPGIYPRGQEMSEMTYLFKYGWGDCPSGCYMVEFWYFIVSAAGEARFVGYWDPNRDARPDWWADARLNIELYRTF